MTTQSESTATGTTQEEASGAIVRTLSLSEQAMVRRAQLERQGKTPSEAFHQTSREIFGKVSDRPEPIPSVLGNRSLGR